MLSSDPHHQRFFPSDLQTKNLCRASKGATVESNRPLFTVTYTTLRNAYVQHFYIKSRGEILRIPYPYMEGPRPNLDPNIGYQE
jgi:hypothetical protein